MGMILQNGTLRTFEPPASKDQVETEQTMPDVLHTEIAVAEPKKRSEQMADVEEEMGDQAYQFDMSQLKMSQETKDRVKHAAGTAARVAGVTAAAAGVAVVGSGVAAGAAARHAMKTTMTGIEAGLTGILTNAMASSTAEERMATAIQNAKDSKDKRKQRMAAMNVPRGGMNGMGGMSL